MHQPLPFLVSIPHGGRETPPELVDRIALSPSEILDDADAFTDKLYDLGDAVESVLAATIARPFVDLNRSKKQLPPDFPDGLIKSRTSYNVPVYRTGMQPDEELTANLIRKYYDPYHDELHSALSDRSIRLLLDCHSMAEYPPPIAPDTTTRRPLVNIGDCDGKSCSPNMAMLLAMSFREAFSFRESDVTVNRPFRGGHITSFYGNNPKPALQVELNRILYLNPANPHREDHARINSVREKIVETFQLFFHGLNS